MGAKAGMRSGLGRVTGLVGGDRPRPCPARAWAELAGSELRRRGIGLPDGKGPWTNSRGKTCVVRIVNSHMESNSVFEGVYPDVPFPEIEVGFSRRTAGTQGQRARWCGGLSTCCGAFGPIPGIYPSDASTASEPACRHGQMSPERGPIG